ncbi:MAG: hypothetical protein NFCOHLIN_01082 [Gammaproteobacteria bacterium]|nr:hypothetical protein [Gammaproteobacteria bacterium]
MSWIPKHRQPSNVDDASVRRRCANLYRRSVATHRLIPLALVIFVAIFTLPSAAAPLLSVSPASQTVTGGSPVTLNLDISGLDLSTSLGGFDVDIGFDPSVLTFNSASFGDPVLGDQLDLSLLGLNNPTATPGPGNINLIEVSFDDEATLLLQQADAFTLVRLFFTAGFVDGTSPITIGVNGLTDAGGNILSATTEPPALIEVTTVPLPSALLMLAGGLAALLPRIRKQYGAGSRVHGFATSALLGERGSSPSVFSGSPRAP